MPDFNVVFEAASINYKVMQKNNSMLQIVSTSIVDFTIVLVRQEGSNETILLKSRENMLIKILPN